LPYPIASFIFNWFDGAYQNQLLYFDDNFWARDKPIKNEATTVSRACSTELINEWRDKETTKEKKRKSEYIHTSKIRLASGSLCVDRHFLPRTDFHRRSDRPIGIENLWITRGPRAEIEPRQSAARAPLVDPRVAISQTNPGHERNLFLSSPCDPRSLVPPSLFPSIRSRAREINSFFFNYRDIAIIIYFQLSLFFFFKQKAPSNRDADCRWFAIVAVSRLRLPECLESSIA